MKSLVNIDLSNNQLQNAVIHSTSSAPANPAEGQMYYDSSTKTMKFYNGTSWIEFGTSNGGVTLDALYPIGSVYLTSNSDFDPNITFAPQQWTMVEEGEYIRSANSSSAGSEYVSGNNGSITLTANHIPQLTTPNKTISHCHSAVSLNNNARGFVAIDDLATIGESLNWKGSAQTSAKVPYNSEGANWTSMQYTEDAVTTHNHTVGSANPEAFDITPNYIALIIWKRRA